MRPRRYRMVHRKPEGRIFTTMDNENAGVQPILLTVDELEALRLSEIEELYHADAAKKMNVSRQTFGRIIKSARKKVASHLVDCKTLIVKGGDIEYAEIGIECESCSFMWKTTVDRTDDQSCPRCGGGDIKDGSLVNKYLQKNKAHKDRGFGFR